MFTCDVAVVFQGISVVVHQQHHLAKCAVFGVRAFGLSLSQRSHKHLPGLVIALLWLWPRYLPVLGLNMSSESWKSAFTRLLLQMWLSVMFLYQRQFSSIITSGFLAASSALITFSLYWRFAKNLYTVSSCSTRMVCASDHHFSRLCTKSRSTYGPLFWLLPGLFRVAVNLPYQRFKISVHHKWLLHLLVVVFELYLVFSLFEQLGPCGPFQLSHAFGFVSFEQLHCHVARAEIRYQQTDILLSGLFQILLY